MKDRHPVEELLNASASDILSAIQRGFRALVDVKGKLAEYFLFQKLERLREQRVIESVEWLDRDGQPDFVIGVGERTLRVECKNVRSGAEGRYRNAEGYKVELQKTRNSKDGTPTRGYRIGEFLRTPTTWSSIRSRVATPRAKRANARAGGGLRSRWRSGTSRQVASALRVTSGPCRTCTKKMGPRLWSCSQASSAEESCAAIYWSFSRSLLLLLRPGSE